jgi:hypothetical protein
MALDGRPVDSLETAACFSSTRAAYALHCLEAAERAPGLVMFSGEAVAEWFKYETEPMELADTSYPL